MTNILDAKKEDLPNFYVLNPMTLQAVPYPDSLASVDDASPDLIMLWARREVLNLEIDHMQKDIERLKQKQAENPDTPLSDEDQAMLTGLGENIKNAQEEKTFVTESHAQLQKEIREGNNDWAYMFKNPELEQIRDNENNDTNTEVTEDLWKTSNF